MARASILTYKGMIPKSQKSFEELMRENVYLTNMLKQKEGQMEAAERQWKEKLVEAVRKATEDEEASVPEGTSIPPPSATIPSVQPNLPTYQSSNPQHVDLFYLS